MTDYVVPVVLVTSVFLLVILTILYRTIVTIPPGQEGLVYHLGRYRRTLPPGFWMVNPLANVLRVSSSPSGRVQPGAVGTVDVAVDPNSYNGRVRVGNTVLAARSFRPIPPGTRVRLVSIPRPIEVVDVEPDSVTPSSH